MKEQNQGHFVNAEQLEILARLETEIHKYAKEGKHYRGFIGMLDAPGNTYKFHT